ncbi:thiol:disulfide interchange protein DsbA/DsbL [Paenacidovorax monticola]|uniref:Thiol:disulfide interchange protein n=1 Tax=Paenacidovorax monticola TaxID=1926868 RepID=A0A7H0HBZ1_9BURK|nr:thiol:disulfide interchange protein DsbA/DsbL [Paenacidovorax monticola]QNP58057.1 thiol:disulfide interchange protein DsbA/DsbL [Paenacidovorax monticola]
MKRREFSLTAATAVAASAFSLPALAQPREGKDYRKLGKPVASEAPAGKIEVVEFFWYSCPHCNAFEPTFAAWMKSAPKDLSVRRVPVAFNGSFVPQQKIYYALEGMGKLEDMHAKVFRAIHVDRLKLTKDDEIFDWMGKQGVDVAKFKEMYSSFTVSNQVRKATQLQEAYGVEGVPSMGVAGRYYTDGTMAGSMQGVLQVVEQLVGTVRKGG